MRWFAAIAAAWVSLPLAAANGSGGAADLRAELLAIPQTAKLGGDTTRPIANRNAFGFLAANARAELQRPFAFGDRLFETNWTEAPGSVKSFDGLGPVFNRVSCSACHVRDGRGSPPAAEGERLQSMLIRLSIPGANAHGGPMPVPGYGNQLGEFAISGVPAEGRTSVSYREVAGAYSDGSSYSLRVPNYEFSGLAYGPLPKDTLFSPRAAPAIFGLGLLQAVPDETLEALSDADDKDGDGISGRVNRVWHAKFKRAAIGRFGWKAGTPSLELQNAAAALGDIGLSSPIHLSQNCQAAQTDCSDATSGGEPELSQTFLAKLTLYTMTLAVPAQRDAEAAEVRHGAKLFRSAGCAACHMPTLKTGVLTEFPELSGQTIHPFTDLLLHDMGDQLADGRPEFAASGTEWRTPPLWGLGLIRTVNGHQNLLHDGRARGPAEAILWHGGEALPAREAFRDLPAGDRAALIAFLNSL